MNQGEIHRIVEGALSNIKQAAEANTIIGQPIVALDGSTILPVSQLTFAYVAGGGEYGKNTKPFLKDGIAGQFAGGSGGGATLTPVGFLLISNNDVKMLTLNEQSYIDKLVDVAYDVLKNVVKS